MAGSWVGSAHSWCRWFSPACSCKCDAAGCGRRSARTPGRGRVVIAVATALVSTGFGLLILAASHETPAALAGLVVPGGLWLTSVSPPRDRLRAGWLTRPLSHLYDAMGEDMQAWCDIRHRAAAEAPQWIADAAKYYYDQVKGRIKDRRALEELCDWRDSIVHKINIVRLINLDTDPGPAARFAAETPLHAEPAPVRRRRPAAAGPPAGERRDQRAGPVPRQRVPARLPQAADLPVPAVGAPLAAGQYAAVKTQYAEVK